MVQVFCMSSLYIDNLLYEYTNGLVNIVLYLCFMIDKHDYNRVFL